jgi:4-hydroxybenzoate polyprenyltransferase
MQNNKPLVVDLDGTLIASDILMEQAFQLIKVNPLNFFLLVYWLTKGFAVLKKEVFVRSQIRPELLPYRLEVLDFVKEQKQNGREIILATASYKENAEPVAHFLGIFDKVFATTPDFNLRGKNKANYLVEQFGNKGFDYIGDSYVDLSIWEVSENAILVEPSKDLLSRAQKISNVEKVFYPKTSKLNTFLRAIRITQWLKNILLFIPLLLAHQFGFNSIINVLLGFLSFGLVSSSVYLLNDLNDLESDRQHPIKKNRPVASGAIHLANAFYIAFFLLAMGLTLGSFTSSNYFFYIQISYFLLNYAYSKYLKNQPIIDIIVLSSFYTMRLVAGGLLAGVEQSDWMITFAIFTFLSFAILKRYAEIKLLQAKGIIREEVRGYRISDEPLLLFSGLSLSFISTLVFILYTQSDKVKLLYTHPKYLIFITPVLLLMTMRIWFNTSRVTETDNPFELLLNDKLNFFLLVIIASIAIFAV